MTPIQKICTHCEGPFITGASRRRQCQTCINLMHSLRFARACVRSKHIEPSTREAYREQAQELRAEWNDRAELFASRGAV